MGAAGTLLRQSGRQGTTLGLARGRMLAAVAVLSQGCLGCSWMLTLGRGLSSKTPSALTLTRQALPHSSPPRHSKAVQERTQITRVCCFSSLENRPLSADSWERSVLLHSTVTAEETFKGLQLARSWLFLALLLMPYG